MKRRTGVSCLQWITSRFLLLEIRLCPTLEHNKLEGRKYLHERPVGGGRVERRDARPARPQPLGQRALRVF